MVVVGIDPDSQAHGAAWPGAVGDKPRLGLGKFMVMRDFQRVWM